MSHHEAEQSGETLAEGALGVPPAEPGSSTDTGGGFDFWLLGLLLVVAGLVAVQNVWLRRKARRERSSAENA